MKVLTGLLAPGKAALEIMIDEVAGVLYIGLLSRAASSN